ncbi:SYM1 [Symbiodinium natans]|uniref:SYM1 protein n=1 Tax=Symbiodinium natans TaxID=878477 RepID=A0A812LK88_9DINO|nr:SYM1 [Symbiodinium natans]
MLAAYSSLLQRWPLTTKGFSAGMLFSLGDVMAQRLETGKAEDLQRLVSFGSYGASWYAISQHYWFAWMESHVATSRPPAQAAVARVCAHSAVFAPFSIVSLFGWMAITTGRSFEELQDSCHPEAVFRVWAAGTIFWIPTMLGVYRFVPLHGRVIVTSGANVLWSCYLSKSAADQRSASMESSNQSWTR